MRELQRVVQGLSKDVENYQDFIRPICEIAGAFLGSMPLLIHLVRCPKAENLPRCFIEKSHRLPDLLCFQCPKIGAPGNSPFPVGRPEN